MLNMTRKQFVQQQALAPSIAKALASTAYQDVTVDGVSPAFVAMCTTPNETHVGVFADKKPKPAHIRHQGARECARRLRQEAREAERLNDIQRLQNFVTASLSLVDEMVFSEHIDPTYEAEMLQRAGERDWQETRLSRAAADRQRAAQWKARHG